MAPKRVVYLPPAGYGARLIQCSMHTPPRQRNHRSMPVTTGLLALIAIVVFISGLAGLRLHAWRPESEALDETRDLINRMSGLVATMSAILLGLLIASANNFYNTEKAGLETLSAQILQLDDLLRRYGPEAQPTRDALKDMVIIGYDRVWQVGGGNPRGPAIEDIQAGIDRMFAILDSMRQKAPDPRAYMLADAASLTAAINSQRLQMVLQLSNSLSWPFMAILVSWTCLLFFGFGMVSRVNRTTVVGLAAGSLTVASAIFLIAELNTPFSGLLRLSPEPIVRTIAALGK
jgi:hypothetical protein